MANDWNNSALFSSCEYILRCAVCFEEYSEELPPVTLQCGHNFCKLCVKRLKKRKYFVKCPVDNIVKRINEKSVNEEFLGTILLFKEILDQGPLVHPQKRSAATQCSDLNDTAKEKVRKTQKIVQNLEANLSKLYSEFNSLIARSYFWSYCYGLFPYSTSVFTSTR